ncbi:MAG: WYL domain-containing protein [Trichlorobacter sp.]|uniref:helix-turn-helix transcriptional regulator n=1 Tax=Trichlorobacter sp. TaxID=2911007 RepID=UPI00255FE4C8|nr:WYL domain-containing protein [Trichlorobacter sp.]MDK9718898.1 WYL domain-containing protein [Trichlorobacter sp.]
MSTLYRHWLMLRMIPRKGTGISTVEICSRLKHEDGIETTLRTIQRDLIELESLFPITSDGKKPSGWKWTDDAASFDIPNMDPVTALTFTLAGEYLGRMLPKGILSALAPYQKSAKQRLENAVDTKLASWPNKVRVMSRNLVSIPPDVSEELAEKVYTALLEEKRFAASYRTVSGKISTYQEVNPLGMVFVDGLTYLIASINQHVDPILLLLHRFQSNELLDKPVTVPKDFDLDEWVEELLTFPVGDTIRLKARFSHQDDIQRIKESPLSDDQKVKELPDGRFELIVSVEDTLQLRWWLNGFGARVEVLAPDSLRQEFVELSRQYSAIYKTSGSE